MEWKCYHIDLHLQQCWVPLHVLTEHLIFFLRKCLFKSYAFLIFLLLLTWGNSLYIVTPIIYQMNGFQVFSPICGLSFYSWTCLLMYNGFAVPEVPFTSVLLLVSLCHTRHHCQPQCHRCSSLYFLQEWSCSTLISFLYVLQGLASLFYM